MARKKLYTLKLTAMEVAVIDQALNAALNGEYDDGDYRWTEEAADAGRSAIDKMPAVDANPNLPLDYEGDEEEEDDED